MPRGPFTGPDPIGLPPPPPPPPSPDPVPDGEDSGHTEGGAPEGPWSRSLAALISLLVIAILFGFFGHMIVDAFDWAWDLWGDLVN